MHADCTGRSNRIARGPVRYRYAGAISRIFRGRLRASVRDDRPGVVAAMEDQAMALIDCRSTIALRSSAVQVSPNRTEIRVRLQTRSSSDASRLTLVWNAFRRCRLRILHERWIAQVARCNNTLVTNLHFPDGRLFTLQICKRSKNSMIGRNFATNAARISGVKPSSGSALARRRTSLSIFHRPVSASRPWARRKALISCRCARAASS